jgi:hypothetical protein
VRECDLCFLGPPETRRPPDRNERACGCSIPESSGVPARAGYNLIRDPARWLKALPAARRGLALPNGLEMSRPASSQSVSRTRFAAAGRVGSIELLGRRVVALVLCYEVKRLDVPDAIKMDDNDIQIHEEKHGARERHR